MSTTGHTSVNMWFDEMGKIIKATDAKFELMWVNGKKGARTGYRVEVPNVYLRFGPPTKYRWCHIHKPKGGQFTLTFAGEGKDPIVCNTRGEAKQLARVLFRLEGHK
jgi:hypothetical protein